MVVYVGPSGIQSRRTEALTSTAGTKRKDNVLQAMAYLGEAITFLYRAIDSPAPCPKLVGLKVKR